MATIKGIQGQSLGILRPVLNEWIETNLRFVREWEDIDIPWWYNERASLSVLAGAVWTVGGLAFEEYSADKRTGQEGRPTYQGRNDLYLSVRKQHFIAEAKYIWSGAARVGPATTTHIQQKLKQACADIRKCRLRGHRRLGVLFAVPYIAMPHKERVKECVDEWVAATKRVDCSCCAWVFPKESRNFGQKFICPGAAVLIQEV